MRPLTPFALAGPASASELYADSCPSRSDCWAVGFFTNGAGAKLGRALHFHNGAWSAAALPEPRTRNSRTYDYLDAVDCTSPSKCWAVGYYGNKARASLNEALNWNGKKWRNVAVPQPAGTARQADQNQLSGVTCTSASSCWAVGAYTNKAGAYLNEALYWNGKKWTLVRAPNSRGTARGEENVLYGVACISTSDCLSVGYGRNGAGQYASEALQWTGTAWVPAPTPRPGRTGTHGYGYLEGVTCESASECWAVGGYNNKRGYSSEIVQWDGSSFRQVKAPNPGSRRGGGELASVSCASATSCWAVGYYYKHAGELDEAVQWNGKRWSRVPTPHPAVYADPLRGVSCALPRRCWAVGYTFSAPGLPMGKLLLRWDGKKWSLG